MKRKVLFMAVVLLGLLAPLPLCAQTSFTVPSSGSDIATTCDAIIYDYGGPSSNYGNSWDGYLVIYPATTGEMMSITSGNYNVENGWDYVYVYNGVGTGGALLATLTGSGSVTTPINSSDPSGALTIRFDSDGSVCSYAGFALRVQCMSPTVMSNDPLTTCSAIWTDPGGLGNYSNNLNVTQTICSDNGEAVTVDFNSFSLGSGDILRVYDGSTATGTPMATYTGSTLPPTLTSSGTCLTFNFISNGSGVSSGWTASILCVRCANTNIVSGSPCTADNIHPFCTDEGQYVYCSGVTGTAADFFGTGSVACLGSTPAPAWYYMRIEHQGNMTIHIEQEDMNGTGIDVDFACWGPFTASSSADFVNKLCTGYYTLHTSYHSSNTTETGYPFGNLTDCSYSAASTENCHILNAQTGDYYLLLITNYEREPGVITFNSVAGSTATTDCSIMAEVSNDGPYCVGDTIHLFCNDPQQGATYSWTGPGGWTSTLVNPVIYPATAAMNGNTYTLVKTLNGVSSAPASTTIDVISVNTSISPADATICPGSSLTLTGSNVSGYTNTYSWTPGGQTNQQITVNPTTTTTYSLTQTVAGRCTGHATVTVNVRQPQHQSYTLDTCASSYSWHGHNANHEGTFHWTWSHQDEYGCTQVDTLHLTISSSSFTQPIDDHNSVPCSWNIQPPTPPTIEVCGNQVPVQLSSTIDHINGGCGYFAYVYQYTVAGTPYTWTYYYHLNPSEFSVPSNRDTLVQCLADVVAPVPPVVVNVCSDTIVPESPTISNHSDGCTGYITYSWLFKDCDNHRKTWSYTYVVADTTRPVFIVPADTFVCRTLEGSYNANPNIMGSPQQVTDNCSSLQDMTIACQDSLHPSIGGGVDTLFRTWVVADDCDNTCAQIQRILIYPPDSAYSWNYICEGEVFDTLGFNFVAYHDTILYQHLQSVHTGCDSVVKVFLTVWHPAHINDTVGSCDSYLWHDSLYTEGGIKTYEHLDANGCKQVDTLHLTLYDSIHVHVYDSACYQYSWDDEVFRESGDFTRHFETVHGCDSAVTLHLTIFDKDSVEFTKQRCKGMAFQWYEHFCENDGDYVTVLQNVHGCDSVVTMHLSFQDTLYADFDDEACNYYVWNNKIYYTTGDFEQSFNVWEGCDSLVTLHLTLYFDDTVSVDTSACESYTWNDTTYFQSGTYEQHFFTEHGCDSLVILHLTILHNSRSSLDSAICTADFPLQWNGVTFNFPGGIDSTVIPNAMGCDSLITMHVTMKPNTSSVLYDTIVQNALPYDTLNMHFTVAGSLQTTISNVYGCDSVVTMILTVLPNILIDLDSTVCENDLPVRWNGLDFIQEGTQNLTFIASSQVDSTLSMHLHVNRNTFSTVPDTVIENNLPHTFNGVVFADSVTNARVIIPNAQGCDSVITYSLHVWRNVSSVVDTAVCDDQLPVVWNGVVFTEAGESQVVLTGAHGEDDTLLMRLHVNTSVHTSLQEELCMSDFPYRYVNGQIDTTFAAGTPPLSIINFKLSTVAGCDSIVTLTLDVMDTSLYIVSSTDFCPNMYTTLSVVTSLEDYVWSTGETTASIAVTEPGEYSVTASTGDCRGRAYRRLAPCKVELRLPNAITPSNSDGLNDCFRLPEACLEQIDDFEIKIFSRWGEMVFYSQDKNFKWYGDYKGHIERDAVYSYTIKYIDKDGIMFRMKGAVTVL
ncbi:MAG: gliding motility-associated C-terminal domain-containing protein [Bacteroidales bacterium]|nr:gliding motility-associated C-terminal domain-containing protein [Bacteroidales bacterium]